MDNKIVYVYNNVIGHFVDDVYISYSKEERKQLFNEIEEKIKKADYNRKLSSLIIGLSMLVIGLTLLILMLCKAINLGKSQWFNFTFIIAGLIVLWVLLYYVFGLLFYKKIKLDYFFKSKKTSNPNSALMYASSNYYKWVNNYSSYLKHTISGKSCPNRRICFISPVGPTAVASFVTTTVIGLPIYAEALRATSAFTAGSSKTPFTNTLLHTKNNCAPLK